jgi:uncharacterized membrane protein YcaP (DUF421 family)
VTPSPEHAPWFFDGWYNVGRAAGLAFIGFLTLIVVLRVSGKRTLSKMNVFDFVFVVAIGSVFAGTLIEKDVTFVEGMVALTTLVVVQTALAAAAARSLRLERLLNGEPTLLLSRGNFIHRAMKKERITEEEVRAAIREQGVERVEDVDAVVLENDGSLTVAYHGKRRGESSLVDATSADSDGLSQKHRKRG